MSLEAGKELYANSLIDPLAFGFDEAVKVMFDIVDQEMAKDPELDRDDFRIVMHKIRDTDGEFPGIENLYGQVINKKTGETVGGFNDSHPCPPFPEELCD